jgi:hypothetical protein
VSAVDERRSGATGGPVVLDIGGDTGAVVVYLPNVPAGGELEMRPAGEPSGRFHTGVHLRPVGGVRIPVAVFPTVRAGRYEVLDDRLAPVAEVTVTGGRVADVDLRPDPPLPGAA